MRRVEICFPIPPIEGLYLSKPTKLATSKHTLIETK